MKSEPLIKISKNKYASRFGYPGFVLGGLSIYLFMIFKSSSGFLDSFFTGITALPISIIAGFASIYYLYNFFKFISLSETEWEDFRRTHRELLSLAVYEHPITRDVRTVRRGFSLPVFMFGAFVPLFKGQYELFFKYLFITIGLSVIGNIIPVIGAMIVTYGFQFKIARKFNHHYENYLIENGYQIKEAKSIVEDVANVQKKLKI